MMSANVFSRSSCLHNKKQITQEEANTLYELISQNTIPRNLEEIEAWVESLKENMVSLNFSTNQFDFTDPTFPLVVQRFNDQVYSCQSFH